ncbi:MAG: TIGR02281 family clan AA aspartic protease [Gammaproteobacteria bacterium]|nr:TIGR02281 family clan AA aspartic protease [Gammaproteobacteria bacterium]
MTLTEVSPEGVKLLAVEADYAVLEIAGKRSIHKLGQSGSLSTTFNAVPMAEVRIARDSIGMYHSHGSINGTAVKFLVDTGATTIALNGSQARRLGIDFKKQGKPIPINTASGNTVGYRITLDRVKLGSIELYSVEAVVLDSSQPQEALLGMSFLGRLEMQNEGSLLRLRKK